MHESRKESIGFAIGSAVIGVFTLYGAGKIEIGSSLGRGAEFLPTILGWLFLLFAVLFLLKGLLTKKETDEKKAEKNYDKNSLIRFFATMGLFVLYVLLFKPVGFVVMTAVFIFCQIMLMAPPEERKIVPAAIIAVVVPVALYLVFGQLLNMPMPDGILSGILH